MKHPLVFAGFAIALIGAALAVLHATAAPAKGPDVLIVQACGTPFADVAKITPANVDAVSCPTPVAINCKTIAEQLAEQLRAKGLQVQVVDAAEAKSRHEVVAARLVVLGSPAHYGTPNWKMVKFVDEVLWQFHALGGERLGGKKFAAYSLGRAEAGAASTVAAMLNYAKSTNGTPGPTATFLMEHSADQVKERVGKLADEIAAALKDAK